MTFDETVEVLAGKTLNNNWFDETQRLDISSFNLMEHYMSRPTSFRWAHPLGLFAFLCTTEEKLERENKMEEFYRRNVDDSLTSLYFLIQQLQQPSC